MRESTLNSCFCRGFTRSLGYLRMSLTSLIRDWVIDPLGLLFLLSLFLLVCLARRRFSLWLLVGAVMWLSAMAFVSAPRVVNPMLLHYEDQFTEQPACLKPLPIVVLGGGVDSRATSTEQLQYLDPPTFVRLNAGRVLAQRYPNVPVLLAGGALRTVSESAVMAHYLREMGVAPARLYEENESRSTHENAINIRQLIDGREFAEEIILVTSALHMKRAKAVFEKQGLEVCAVAVDRHGIRNVPGYALWPQTSALLKFDLLLHEIIATIAYKVSGRL